ncbi:MAG: hypothetical protein ABI689_02710 [Thermoanaerobaculia bacterium]
MLRNRAQAIDEAMQGLTRAALPHYSADEATANRVRLEKLYDLCLQCIAERSLIPICDYARQVAGERHREGFHFQEVHTAFNVLEEVIWRLITSNLQPPQLVAALGQASTVLGAGKQALAIEFVRLAGHPDPAESLDLSALFKGTT